MSLLKINWPFLIVLLLPFSAIAEKLEYKLTSTLGNPENVKVFVDTSHLGKFSLIRPRQIPNSFIKKAPSVDCIANSRKQKVKYEREYECDRLVWEISFDAISKDGFDVSNQENIHNSNKWWVLFEWGDIPRIKGHPDIDVCVIEIKSKNKKCRSLPAVNEAPLIFVWGNSSAQNNFKDSYFNLYIDNDQRILKILSWKQLLSQFNYLNQLLLKGKGKNKNFDIVWIGYEKSKGFVGGAAGSETYVANYGVENGKITESDISRLLWISGHEEFHMLSPYSFPLWVSESLAQYYGYKSLSKTGLSSKSPLELWNLKKNDIPHSNTGLYAANRKVVDERNMSYYGLFYDKGAAFWNEVDDALKRKGVSLDSFIQLLSNTNGSEIELNKNFVVAIENVLTKRFFNSLVAKYLSQN